MAKVKKLNRVLTVEDSAVPSYLKAGYDEIDEKGEVVKRATGGRTVSIAEYNKVLDEVESLKAENKKLKTKLKKAE
ncbi:hypothetical protein [Cytobacillus firmus]|uniref:Uncharacterized protein n=1 Tax=Cytobacillus firmus TaxID=1399 RepID=A0AA46NZJ8_CYTFI|nr:hypothetical protein [Cytobacillus firmus]UYG93191.1 hypothetical protein OD459_12925 [Cytobacillus firmus]